MLVREISCIDFLYALILSQSACFWLNNDWVDLSVIWLPWYFFWFIACHSQIALHANEFLQVIINYYVSLFRNFLIAFWKASKSPQFGIRALYEMMEGMWHLNVYRRSILLTSIMLLTLVEKPLQFTYWVFFCHFSAK